MTWIPNGDFAGSGSKGAVARTSRLPAVVSQFLQVYVERMLAQECAGLTSETALFWSTWGRRVVGKTRAPMTRKNIWTGG